MVSKSHVRTRETPKVNAQSYTSGHPELNFEERLVLHFEKFPVRHTDN